MIELSTETDNRRKFDQHLLSAIGICVALILATPLIISTNTIFPFIVGKAIFARSIIEILFTLWLILIICYPQHRPSKSWVMISLSIGLPVSIITSLTGVGFTRSLWSTFERMSGVIDQAHWLAFILVIGTVYRNLSNWRVLFTLNLGVAGFVSIIGIIQYYNWIVNPFLLEEVTFSDSTDYIESTWGNSAYMAIHAMINSLLGLGLILQSIRNEQIKPALSKYVNRRNQPGLKLKRLHFLQIFWLLNTSLCFWALLLSASRWPFINSVLGVLILSVGYRFWKIERIKAGIVYLILFLALVVITIPIVSSVADNLRSSMPVIWRIFEFEEDRSYSRHKAAFETVLDAYWEKPVFGWGPENYLVPWGKYVDIVSGDEIPSFDAAHSALLEKLVTQGALGILSSILIFSTIIIVLRRSINYQTGHYRYFVIVVTVALAASYAQKLLRLDNVAITLQLSLLMAFVVSEESKLRTNTENDTLNDSRKPHSTKPKRVWLRVWLIVPIVVASIWSLYNYNYKPYQAAQSSGELLRASLWTDISANFNRSVDEFPAFANISRRLMIGHVGCGIATMAHTDYVEAVDLVTKEGQEALRIEPQNWRMHIALAKFYQLAHHRNSDYSELANAHVQEALRLAPNTGLTIRVKIEQDRLGTASSKINTRYCSQH